MVYRPRLDRSPCLSCPQAHSRCPHIRTYAFSCQLLNTLFPSAVLHAISHLPVKCGSHARFTTHDLSLKPQPTASPPPLSFFVSVCPMSSAPQLRQRRDARQKSREEAAVIAAASSSQAQQQQQQQPQQPNRGGGDTGDVIAAAAAAPPIGLGGTTAAAGGGGGGGSGRRRVSIQEARRRTAR